MLDVLMLGAAALMQDNRPSTDALDPRPGPTMAEQRTLSQPHPNMDLHMFPDNAVKDLRIDGDTLHVLVTNEGGVRSTGGIRIAAEALANGVKVVAPPVRSAGLKAGESRWVAVSGFYARSAATSNPSMFVLNDASLVSATVLEVPRAGGTLDRSGQACDPDFGCGKERNLANNGLRTTGRAITRGRP